MSAPRRLTDAEWRQQARWAKSPAAKLFAEADRARGSEEMAVTVCRALARNDLELQIVIAMAKAAIAHSEGRERPEITREAEVYLPFCACGRRVSECDGSRAACGKQVSR